MQKTVTFDWKVRRAAQFELYHNTTKACRSGVPRHRSQLAETPFTESVCRESCERLEKPFELGSEIL